MRLHATILGTAGLVSLLVAGGPAVAEPPRCEHDCSQPAKPPPPRPNAPPNRPAAPGAYVRPQGAPAPGQGYAGRYPPAGRPAYDRGPGGGGRGPVFSQDRRFSYRGRSFAAVRVGPYRYPRGWGYRPWRVGERFPLGLLLPDYFIADFALYNLAPPGPSLEWVRYGPDALLVNTYTGQVVDVAYGVFEEDPGYADAGPPPDYPPPGYPPPGYGQNGYGPPQDPGDGYPPPPPPPPGPQAP
jgi:hypothetical protein